MKKLLFLLFLIPSLAQAVTWVDPATLLTVPGNPISIGPGPGSNISGALASAINAATDGNPTPPINLKTNGIVSWDPDTTGVGGAQTLSIFHCLSNTVYTTSTCIPFSPASVAANGQVQLVPGIYFFTPSATAANGMIRVDAFAF